MRAVTVLLVLLINVLPGCGQNRPLATQAAEFLSMLDDSLAAKAYYPFDDEERFNWHFVPRSRNGVSLNDLNEEQRQAALSLLRASLSEQGYRKARDIMALENVLRKVENRPDNDTYRDPLNYYFTIFGDPKSNGVWGWRFEGHHISVNFSSRKNEIVSSTPSFMGSNPGIVRHPGLPQQQVLKRETDLGFTLVNALSIQQLRKAVIADKAPDDIITGNRRKAELLEPRGLSFSEMNDQQQRIFMQLLNVYVRNYQFGFARRLMEKIEKAGIENLHFAWAGSLQPGAGHYYRIQGPMLLIEYDNTQNNANHVHTVVRDLTNDFAEDILREHYEREHRND